MAVSHIKSDTIADWTGTVTVFNSQGSTATVAATDIVRPSDWNSVHNQFYTLTGNTTNSSTASGTNVVFSGAGNITLGGTGGNTFVVSGPDYISWLTRGRGLAVQIHSSSYLDGSRQSIVIPILLPQPGSFSYIRIPVSIDGTQASGSTSAASMNGSVARSETWNAVMYSLGTGISSRSLISVASDSCSSCAVYSISVAANGTQYSVTEAQTFYVEGNSSSISTGYSSSTSNYTFHTSLLTNINARRYMDVDFNNSLEAGMYWLAIGASTSSDSNSARCSTATAAIQRLITFYVDTQTNAPFLVMNQTNSLSNPLIDGIVSTNVGGTISGFPISAISSGALQPVFQITMIRQA